MERNVLPDFGLASDFEVVLLVKLQTKTLKRFQQCRRVSQSRFFEC